MYNGRKNGLELLLLNFTEVEASGTLRLNVPKLAELKLEEIVKSPSCSIANLQWYLKARQEMYENRKWLGVYASCKPSKEPSRYVCCEACVHFKLLPQKADKLPHTADAPNFKGCSAAFDVFDGYGVPFMKWDDVLNPENGYIQEDGGIIVETTITIKTLYFPHVYKFHYFDGRGTGEVVRQIFEFAGAEYEDVRYSLEQWPAVKSKFPFGQLPVLEVDGKMISQSAAISRFVAKHYSLAGKNDWDAALVDEIVDQYKDYYVDFRKWHYVVLGFQEGDKAESLKKHGAPARDKFYPPLVSQLKKTGSGFLVGDQIIEHSKKISALPKIKAWIEKRDKTPW